MAQKRRNSPQKPKRDPDDIRNIGVRGFVGIAFLVGGLWNLPMIWHRPANRADWLLLSMVAGMFLIGIALLIIPFKDQEE